MLDFDDITRENLKEHNPSQPQTEYPHRILITEVSESEKINSLFNLINQQPDIDQIYLYANDPYDLYEPKYQFLINKGKLKGLKIFNDPKAFIEYSHDTDDIYKIIEEYNPNKGPEILIAFDDKIHIMVTKKGYIQW